MTAAWRRAVAGMAVAAAVVGGSSTASAAEEPHRVNGDEVPPATAAGAADTGPAEYFVPMPDLGLAQRRSDGGLNLARFPLADLEPDFGRASTGRTLPAR